jgi:hypothetical protein
MSKIKSLSGFQVVPGPQTKEADALQDWASELRPSMRKLRQGMDSLCKTARLGNERNVLKFSFNAIAKKHMCACWTASYRASGVQYTSHMWLVDVYFVANQSFR